MPSHALLLPIDCIFPCRLQGLQSVFSAVHLCLFEQLMFEDCAEIEKMHL